MQLLPNNFSEESRTFSFRLTGKDLKGVRKLFGTKDFTGKEVKQFIVTCVKKQSKIRAFLNGDDEPKNNHNESLFLSIALNEAIKKSFKQITYRDDVNPRDYFLGEFEDFEKAVTILYKDVIRVLPKEVLGTVISALEKQLEQDYLVIPFWVQTDEDEPPTGYSIAVFTRPKLPCDDLLDDSLGLDESFEY